MEKQDTITCSYGTIDWGEKIESDGIKDDSYDGLLPWGENVLHLCIDNEKHKNFPLKLLLKNILPKLKDKNPIN